MFYSFGWESSSLLKECTAAKTNVTFKKSFCFASTLLSLVLHSSCSLTRLYKFLKTRKLDKGEDTQDLRQPIEATSSKLPKNDGINQQVKVRRYCKSYVALGFTWTGNPNCPSPLCIVCGEKLSNSAMAPAKLKRHLTTKHPESSSKTEQYLKRELELNEKQISTFSKKFKLSDKAQEASYAVAEIVASKMKSYTIAESVILPACQQIVRIMFGEHAALELKKLLFLTTP